MEKSRDFFETAFGWELLKLRTGGRAMDMTDGEINITLIQQPEDCQRPTLEEGNEYIHFGVIVDDVDDCRQRLDRWGAEFLTETIKHAGDAAPNPQAQQSFKVLDPDGNIIDVTGNQTEWLGVQMR